METSPTENISDSSGPRQSSKEIMRGAHREAFDEYNSNSLEWIAVQSDKGIGIVG